MEVSPILNAALHQPLLSDEQKQELLGDVRAGNTQALNDLTMGFVRMIVGMTNWKGFEENRDDLIQEGIMIVRRAVERYALESRAPGAKPKAPLTHWVAGQLRWRMLKLIQRETDYRTHYVMMGQHGGENRLDVGYGEGKDRPDRDPGVEWTALVRCALEAEELTDEDIEVLEARANGLTYAEIGKRIGTHRGAVSQRYADAIERLKEFAGVDG